MTTKAIKELDSITGDAFSLGKAIWSIRCSDEISQVEFAKKLGISKQYLCDIEHNRKNVSVKKALLFAKILGYPKTYFVKLALQDMLNKANVHLEVELKKSLSSTH